MGWTIMLWRIPPDAVTARKMTKPRPGKTPYKYLHVPNEVLVAPRIVIASQEQVQDLLVATCGCRVIEVSPEAGGGLVQCGAGQHKFCITLVPQAPPPGANGINLISFWDVACPYELFLPIFEVLNKEWPRLIVYNKRDDKFHDETTIKPIWERWWERELRKGRGRNERKADGRSSLTADRGS